MIITVTLSPAIDRILAVPGFRARRTLKARVVAVVPAGKGVNVSRYLSALGVRSVATGFVGARERALYEESFAGTGITPAFVAVDAPTRLNTTILGERGRRETHLREEGFAAPREKREALRRTLLRYARAGNTFVFAGALPLKFAPAELARLIRELRASGAAVAVDASGPALAAAVRAGCDVISPNEDELRETGMSPELLLRRVGALALKLGAKGGVLYLRDGTFRARAAVPARRVLNTVGAGDAFLAGLLAARAQRLSPSALIRSAVAAGAAAVVAGVVGRLDRATWARFRPKPVL